MTDADRGLEASPAFAAYQARLRKRWPANPELERKYGVSAGNGQFYESNMSDSQTGETDAQLPNTDMGRRAFCVGAATTIALAGAGIGAANEDALNYPSDFVGNPAISGQVTKARHEPEFGPLEYLDDSGETAELPAVVDYRDPTDTEETISNVFGFAADRVDASEFRLFPRNVTREDADGEEEDVTAIDADEWTADADLLVSEGDLDIDSVSFAGDGLADGATATATFDAGDAADLLVEDDINRRYFQIGVNVDQLPSGSMVEFAAVASNGDRQTVVVDPAADDGDDDVVATTTGHGKIYQMQLGELTGSLDDIEHVEVAISDADAAVTIFGLNLERMSRWEFGERVDFENTDDEETNTLRSIEGDVTASELFGLTEDARIYDLEVPVRYTAWKSEAGGDWYDEPAEHYPAYDARLTQVERLEVPTGYDLAHSDLQIDMHQGLPSDRYHALELAEDTVDDDDEDDMDFSDVSGSLGSAGDTISLEDFPTTGTEYTVRVRTILTNDELDVAMDAPAMGGGSGARGTSGGWFSGVRGLFLAIGTSVAGWLTLSRFRGE